VVTFWLIYTTAKTCINKLLTKPTKPKENENEVVIYRKITPLEAFVN
jgi:hypothetical protein